MDKTKIDWADATWNPVTGCLHGCEYCYARGIAKRFCSNEHGHDTGAMAPCTGDCQSCSELDGHEFVGELTRYNHNQSAAYPYGFMPTFHPHRLDQPSRWTKPRTIFVCSMADLFGEWVPDKWIEEVINACLAAPQHRYLFLTKNPARYMHLIVKGIIPEDQQNFWLGSTATVPETEFFWHDTVNTFLSIEPILAPFKDLSDKGQQPACYVDWIIVGAETGNRKGKIVPEKSWIMELVRSANLAGTPIFMKESLRPIMGDDFVQRFPWEESGREK